NISFSVNRKKDPKKLDVKLSQFFYSKYYNPCLGHQVAVDTHGRIKPCLWFDKILGNVRKDDLKDMIIAGIFDPYWESAKHKIETCKECELRFACDDCRVFALKKGGGLEAKPSYCEYDPYTGE
ncbi:MAG: SPASM domain-containing protein, partial [bacterium]|nr:SPASM domain-containing protein [bacterium]